MALNVPVSTLALVHMYTGLQVLGCYDGELKSHQSLSWVVPRCS